MHIVDSEPWTEDSNKITYLIKNQTGPGGHVIGVAVIFKPDGTENWLTICSDKAFDYMKKLCDQNTWSKT